MGDPFQACRQTDRYGSRQLDNRRQITLVQAWARPDFGGPVVMPGGKFFTGEMKIQMKQLKVIA